MGQRREIGDQAPPGSLEVLGQKRDRKWEREQRKRGVVATYRGIPPEVQDRVKEIAKKHQVNIGDVARRFLEYALRAYDAGELELQAVVIDVKKSLYPGE